MEAKLMVPRCYARTVLTTDEQERLAAQNWLFAHEKTVNRARNADAADKRTKREAMRAAGYRQLQLWMSPEAAAVVARCKRKGESYAQLLERLCRQSSLL